MSDRRNVPTEQDIVEDDLRQARSAMTEIRDLASDLYAMRGEDELINQRCHQIMAIAKRHS